MTDKTPPTDAAADDGPQLQSTSERAALPLPLPPLGEGASSEESRPAVPAAADESPPTEVHAVVEESPPTEVHAAIEEDSPPEPEPVAETPEPQPEPDPLPPPTPLPDPEPAPPPYEPAASAPPTFDTPDQGGASVLTERPEIAVGAAFAGGLIVAFALKRLAS